MVVTSARVAYMDESHAVELRRLCSILVLGPQAVLVHTGNAAGHARW